MADTEGNRGSVRRTLMIYLNCKDLDRGREAGKIVDITIEGIQLLSPEMIPTGREARYEIELPPSPHYSAKTIRVRGICRWSRKEPLQELYSMGIAFVQPEPESAELITLLIDRLGFSDGQKKIFTTSGDIGFK